jgi:hypothetical protein
MSIWGAGFTENDDAADWLIEYLESPDLLLLNDAFDEVFATDKDDCIEVDDGANALLAAAIFLEILGVSKNEIIEAEDDLKTLQNNLQKMSKSALKNMLDRAIKSVDIVANQEERSELRALMDEDRDLLKTWLDNTAALTEHLTKKRRLM